MAGFKQSNFGVYGTKDRALQKSLSFERTSLSSKSANVWLYEGSDRNGVPALTDVDTFFNEVSDRSYNQTPIQINIWHEPLEEGARDLSTIGIIDEFSGQVEFRAHVSSFDVDGLGRYLVPGDVLEIPFFLEDGQKAYFFVEDVDRKAEFENFFVIIHASPVTDSQEFSEIPNIPSNSDIMDVLDAANEADVEADVALDGLDDGANVDPYDPRRTDDERSFLDDPGKDIF